MMAFSSHPSRSLFKLAVVIGVGQCLVTVATKEKMGSFLADVGGAIGLCTQLIATQTVKWGEEREECVILRLYETTLGR